MLQCRRPSSSSSSPPHLIFTSLWPNLPTIPTSHIPSSWPVTIQWVSVLMTSSQHVPLHMSDCPWANHLTPAGQSSSCVRGQTVDVELHSTWNTRTLTWIFRVRDPHSTPPSHLLPPRCLIKTDLSEGAADDRRKRQRCIVRALLRLHPPQAAYLAPVWWDLSNNGSRLQSLSLPLSICGQNPELCCSLRIRSSCRSLEKNNTEYLFPLCFNKVYCDNTDTF